MHSSSATRPRFSEDPQGGLPEYRPPSILALAGLLIGVASVVVLVEPGAWPVPLLGAVVSAVSLLRIARPDSRLTGRGVAMVGFGLSVAMGVAAPANRFCYDKLIRREAEQFGYRWFELLRRYEPDRAFELTKHPENRLPPSNNQDAPDTQRQRALEAYMTSPVVQKLLTLGEKAEIRYERTEGQDRAIDGDLVTLVYAVTSDEAGRTETFHVALILVRLRLVETDKSGTRTAYAQWQVRRSAELSPHT